MSVWKIIIIKVVSLSINVIKKIYENFNILKELAVCIIFTLKVVIWFNSLGVRFILFLYKLFQ